MNELIFLVEDSQEGGYNARALGESIFTQGTTLDDLSRNIREAVLCHFEEANVPKIIRIHYVRNEILEV